MTRYVIPMLVFTILSMTVDGFTISRPVNREIFSPTSCMTRRISFYNHRLHLSGNGNNNLSPQEREEKLSQLGFAESKKMDDNPEDVNVNVNLIDDVDPVTITALGFAAIAANFLIFANMGDGGIGGVVARIINFFR